MRSNLRLVRCVVAALLPLATVTHGQTERPSVMLEVDATEAPRGLLHARETISVRSGPLTLLYPKWIPGEHGPTGPIVDMAGLKILAGANALSWRRDLENMYALHVEVPTGVDRLDVSFDYILPPQTQGFSSAASASPELLVLSWNQTVVYPNTGRPDGILVSPSLRLPEGWKYASALATKAHSNGVITFESVSLSTLVDSPVLSGRHFRHIDLTPPGGVPHFLEMASDDEAALSITPEQENAYRRLVLEANALFGAHHYRQYHFLYTLSEHVAHFGLEHHESSDDRVSERALVDDNIRKPTAALLPHEFVHSWNGKYRRPAGLATGDFSTPMKTDLLWVYEGLTQYLGKVLTARSGLRTPDEYLDDLAIIAATLDNRPGREWRPLQDTSDEAQLLYYARGDWDTLRRSTDFYDEGNLIWLEADVTIRRLSKGQKSLDDFCKRFHGGTSGGPGVVPYTFDDVLAALDTVTEYDWRGFFETRLRSLSGRAPLGGIESGGWRLVYTDKPSSMQVATDALLKATDFRYSIGLLLRDDGTVQDVIPGTAAVRAGMAPGMTVVAVNGRKYSSQVMRDALRSGRAASVPLELLASNADFYRTYLLDYHGGERYPHLDRNPAKPDVLAQIIAPAVK